MVAHTNNPVPFIVKDFSDSNAFVLQSVKVAGLANVAATVLNLLGFEAPLNYEPSLIKLS